MSNIMSQLKFSNKTSRNAFDLSRKNAFTAKVGELLPVACIECIPGHKVKGKIQHFTRTMPVNTAAYTRIREYYDWFFVPTNLLWNKFNTFVTQMKDNSQHATSINGSTKLTEMHPYFTTNQVSNYLTTISSGSTPNLNEVGLSRAKQSAKLLDYLGYGNFYNAATGTAQSFAVNANLNPFPLLAYQKIYQDFYRNSQWEAAYAPSFNIDYMTGAAESLNIPVSSLASEIMGNRVFNMFDLRYANWNKDLFMGVMPNSQYGNAASIIDNTSVTPYEDYLLLSTTTTKPVGTLVGSTSQGSANFPYSVSVNAGNTQDINLLFDQNQMRKLFNSLGISSFSILALRQAEALQKWKEITQSQQQDYKNQIEAHFGVSPSDALSERCKFIDGSVSSLDISEVTNTNITGEYAADIAGKGVGVGNGNMNFTTDVHGYLMCIYHAVPLLDYANDGISKVNLKTLVTDYAIPELDATGMVQVSVPELSNSQSVSTYANRLLGYAPRYYDYKTAIDQVHGAFINGGLGAWVAPVDSTYLSSMLALIASDVQWKFYKIRPQVLNPIFALDADSDVSSDQLLVNANFEITAVLPLDRNGLPY